MKKFLRMIPLTCMMALSACAGVVDHAIIDTEKSTFEVGILQIITHDALDASQKGFVDAIKSSTLLSEKNVNFTIENAEGDETSQASMAKSLVIKCDLLLGISTGSSIALKNARDEAGKKQPLLFTAVTDPVDAKLMKKMTNHDGSVTGTSDDNPVEAQIDLIKKCFPNKEAKDIKLGILYTSSEPNSEVQAKRAEKEAKKEGIGTVKKMTCNDSSDIKSVCNNLAHSVDVLYIPTDNNIAAHMDSVKSVTDEYHTLCIVGEENMLKNGGHITYSVSYPLLGKRTGEMAADILSGNKLTEKIDAEKMVDDQYLSKVFSSSNLAASGINLPSGLTDGFTDLG
ncbi:MAG: ABC transporter substrate-binding protein [Bacilli bacterium]|nr:ABC transporter substrate-binding protein [Bacilli bacterium]